MAWDVRLLGSDTHMIDFFKFLFEDGLNYFANLTLPQILDKTMYTCQ